MRRAACAKDPSCQTVQIAPSCFWKEGSSARRAELSSAVCHQCQSPWLVLLYYCRWTSRCLLSDTVCPGCPRTGCSHSRPGCAKQPCSDGSRLAASSAGCRLRCSTWSSGSVTAVVAAYYYYCCCDDDDWLFELPASETIWKLCSNQ